MVNNRCKMAGKGEKGPPDGMEREGEGAVLTETEKKLERPKLYKVLLLNDDYTTMEFVVTVLMNIFHHPQEEAVRIMLEVHHNGAGVAGVYSYEVAETKMNMTIEMARQNEFPLRCALEPE
jgi:ATP-dependent Clp protease adaptor protein ClpS